MSKFNQILKSNKISPDNLKLLYGELQLFRNSSFYTKNEQLCSDIISLIVEYLIYGDKNNPGIFDVFCEYNFMNELIYLNSLGSRVISIQIIQSLSIMILNITNPMTIYFMFSNNFINQIISLDYSNYDDEFIAYYVNFMKSLSLKIDSNTIQFFFHEQHNSFSLIESSMKLYNHPDSMIRTTVRNIFLTFLKLKFQPIYDYFTKLPSISYFSFLVINLRELILKLNEETLSDDFKNLNDINDDILDIIMYFQDIFSIKNNRINNVLTNCIFYYIVFPLLIGAITSMNKPKINIPISIYIITLFFKYIKEECFVNMLFSLIFFSKIDPVFINYIKEYPQFPKNYHHWNHKKTSQELSFANYITVNFSENFIKSLIFQVNSEFPEIIAIVKKYEKTAQEYTEEDLYKSILEDVLSKFEPSEFNSMQNFHKNLSIGTGENIGLKTFDFKQKSIVNLTEHFYFKMKENIDSDFVINESRENLLCYFRSKDDSLILLLSLLFNTVHKSTVSKEVLSCGRLLKACDFIASELSTNNILKEIFSNINLSELESDRTSNDFSFNRDIFNSSDSNEPPSNNSDNLLIEEEEEEEEEKEFTCNKEEEPIKRSLEETTNQQESNEEQIETNSLIDKEFLKIQTEKIIVKTHKRNISKKNLDKIIKINMENKISINRVSNPNTKECVFDNKFFYRNFSKMKFQSEYDKDLIDNLLNLLTVEPAFRTITLRLILENLENLILQGPIDKHHLNLFNKIYFTYVSGIKLNIMTNKTIKENGYDLLETEWLDYKKDFNSTINSIVSQPYLLIPFNLEVTITDYPSLLKIQMTEIENFKNSLIIFMNLYDLRSKVFLLFDNIKEFFPLNIGATHFEIDKPFFITNSSELYSCKLKSGSNKNPQINIFMCIDQNYLVFCLPDSNRPEYAIVKNKYALRHIEVQIDRGDPRVLNLLVKEKNTISEQSIYLDDINKANTLKKQLEEHKKNSKNTEFILLVSYFDELLNKFNLDYNI